MTEVKVLESERIYDMTLQYRRRNDKIRVALLDYQGDKSIDNMQSIEVFPKSVHCSKDGKHWEVKNHRGKRLFKGSYDFSHFPFQMNEERYVIQQQEHYGLQDLESNCLIPCKFDGVQDWDSQYIAMQKNRKTLVFNAQGQEVLPGKYDNVHILGNNLFEIIRKDKRALYHREIGFLTPYDDFEFTPFHQGIGGYRLGDQEWGLIDSTGRRVKVPELEVLQYLDQGVFIFCFEESRWGVINDQQKILFPPQYNWVSSLGNGYLTLSKNAKVALVNMKGEQILPFQFNQIQSLDGRNFLCQDRLGFRFYDDQGDLMFTENFSYAVPFLNGIAYVVYKGKSYLLNLEGKSLNTGEKIPSSSPLWQ